MNCRQRACINVLFVFVISCSAGQCSEDQGDQAGINNFAQANSLQLPQGFQRHLLQVAPAPSKAPAAPSGNYTLGVNYNGEVLNTTTARSPDDCYLQCLHYQSDEGVRCNVFVYCGYTNCTFVIQNISQTRLNGSCNLQFQVLPNESDPDRIMPNNQTTLGSGTANTYSGDDIFMRGTYYDGVWTDIFVGIKSHKDCRQKCIDYNDVEGQYCNIYNYCTQLGGCQADLYSPSYTVFVPEYYQHCNLKFQPGLGSATAPPFVNNSIASLGSGTYFPAKKTEEFAKYGDFMFGANYPNATTMRIINGSQNYVECYKACQNYTDEGQFCNVFVFCDGMFGGTCDDGDGSNITDAKTCFLKVQSADSLLSQRTTGGSDIRQRQLGSGYLFNDSQLERFAANGNLIWNVAYDSQVFKTGFESTPEACYNMCKNYSSAPGSYANVFSYCGAMANCTVEDGSESLKQSFGQCNCSWQDSLRNFGQLPVKSFLVAPTNIASGVISSNSSRPMVGNLSFNVEYDGIYIAASSQANVSECFNSCKNSQGNLICNIFAYCAADASVGCPRNLSPGRCLLKNQPGLDPSNPNPSILSSRTNLASGFYFAPPPPPPSHTAAIVGEVFGGVVGGVCAIVLAAFSYFKAKRLLASWKKKRNADLFAKALLQSENHDTFPAFSTEELVRISDLPSMVLLDIAHLQLSMNGIDPNDTTIVRAAMPNDPNTLTFESDRVEGEFAVPAEHEKGSLEDTWRIDPQQLHCRRRTDGELYKLGDGGVGSVYLGVLFGTTNVAIKVVRSPTPAQQQSFIKEIMILKACHHPNVITFLGASIQAQQTLLVMEAMPGGDLYSQIEKDATGRFTWYQRGKRIALDVVRGLGYLHTHKILHLDMKSPNILLGSAGAKIADLGLGHEVKEGETDHKSYQASSAWCAPEQLVGDPCTPATDIFAMGVIIWELCTGMQAPTRRDYRAVIQPQEAPEAITNLIRRCMAAEPAHRPDASELHDIIMSSNNADK